MIRRSLYVMAGFAATLASPALAAKAPTTRTVACGAESCVQVSGRRADRAAPVVINGQQVAVNGGRHWRVRLPVETVRAWSVPYARTIMVTVGGAEQEAALPIGLLGHAENLAMLVVSVK